jgi:hypothetical protein
MVSQARAAGGGVDIESVRIDKDPVPDLELIVADGTHCQGETRGAGEGSGSASHGNGVGTSRGGRSGLNCHCGSARQIAGCR